MIYNINITYYSNIIKIYQKLQQILLSIFKLQPYLPIQKIIYVKIKKIKNNKINSKATIMLS